MASLTERYALERVIGRGASGSVWAARDIKLNRPVAIKQLDRQFADDVESCLRFEREAWTIAQLRSPHIVQVFDSGVDGGVPFIVMERLYGESLDERIARYRHPSRLPPRIASGIIADVARGLTISHDAGIVHRDLKPGNVFLASENRREIAKLLDFGIARVVADRGEPADPGMLAGTPQFMSPEHFDGQPLDGRSDLWSLAVIAYEMLTGLLPFSGETLQELRDRIRTASFLQPSEVRPDLDRGVDQVFERAFARSPGERFASAAELAVAFDQVAGDSARLPVARVLFVDDEADMETLLRQRLRREVNAGRYELLFARNADEGLRILATRPDVDVVFADINMADKGRLAFGDRDSGLGREGLAFLAQAPAVSPIVRVVMLSAHYENREYVRIAMNNGAFDFLRKPIDFTDLRQTIDKCAADARQLRQLLDSHQENEVLRGLIGRAAVDRLVAEVRAADASLTLAFPGTIALLTVPGTHRRARTSAPQPVFGRLNAHFDLFVPEIQGRSGSVQGLHDDYLVALFQGRDHLRRAVEACVAIVERVRLANGLLAGGSFDYSMSAAVGSGSVLEGRLGSTRVGRIESTLLGEAMEMATELKALGRPLEILVSDAVAHELEATHRSEPDPSRKTSQGLGVYRVIGPASSDGSRASPTLPEGGSTLAIEP